MKIQESGEMYLETILVLQQQKNVVRAIDVANKLCYSKPSVSRALGLLQKAEYITVSQDGAITFTQMGKDYAVSIYERHENLTKFIMSLGVSNETAENDACRIEHVISDETYEAIKRKVN